MKTAPYRALRTDAALSTVVRTDKASPLQMQSWMRDLTEIAVLDYILSQQDRFGNIDFEKKYVYVQDGQVKTRDFDQGLAGIENLKPQVLKVTHLGDNDASVHPTYANFTKKHGYLQNLYHFSGKIYSRLFDLSADFKSDRLVAKYLKSELDLNDKEIARIESQLNEVVEILKSQCLKGKLRFDLDEPKKSLLQKNQELQLDCNSPRM
jgi:hypothetical protein